MKFDGQPTWDSVPPSPPVWVAWIEIVKYRGRRSDTKSPPVWVAWIEMPYVTRFYKWQESSPPVWVAWIEIERNKKTN